MDLFQLILKQMRQRALGTWLTLLSVLLGVALATAVMLVRRESGQLVGQTRDGYEGIAVGLGAAVAAAVMLGRRESEQLFGQTEYGYDVIVGPKGSKLQLVLNSVYH